MPSYDAIVVGAGPNGLAAAITLARAGHTVLVVEAQATPGGGARSGALTLPGFVHDLGSAVHPFGIGSPFFRALPLHEHGLVWVHPPAPLAHPFDDGTATVLERAIDATGTHLGVDAAAYGHLMAPAVRTWERLSPTLLTPLHLLRHPLALAGFGLRALWPVHTLARALFRGERARGLLAGISAHACLPLERLPSAAFGLVLGMLGHAVGWPVPRGGSPTRWWRTCARSAVRS
jgi:phytoene dehydrogenase-like protein